MPPGHDWILDRVEVIEVKPEWESVFMVLALAGLLIGGLVFLLAKISRALDHRRARGKILRVCQAEGHDWSGCVCRRCGETRDEGHQWTVKVCERCGGTGYVGHSLSYGNPNYGDPDYPGNPCDCISPERTLCTVCGKERRDH